METPSQGNGDMTPGINGLGRIGKLTLWHQVACEYLGEIVVNIDSETGTELTYLAHYLERDSSYGSLQGALYCVTTTGMGYLAQSIKAISQQAWSVILALLLISFWKSLRETIVSPDRVESAFRQWATFLGLSEKWRVWFIALYVISGMADQISRRPKRR